MTRKTLITAAFVISVALGVILAALPAQGAHANDEPAEVIVSFGCLEADVAVELAHVHETMGYAKYSDAAALYVENGECIYIPGGYPAYIDRVVKRTNYRFKGQATYVVEAHFWGALPGKTFYLLYYGELPARAHRSSA